jgi:hypothetical protein
MRVLLGAMIGFGAGLVVAGIAAIISPFSEPVHNVGIIGLGAGLLIGGIVAAVISRNQEKR